MNDLCITRFPREWPPSGQAGKVSGKPYNRKQCREHISQRKKSGQELTDFCRGCELPQGDGFSRAGGLKNGRALPSRGMIPKKNRLPVQETRGRRSEKVIQKDLLTVRVYPGGNTNRFGVVVSLGVDKRSVRRHFWKRKILDVVAHWPNMKKDFVIIAMPRLKGAQERDVFEALRATRDALERICT